MFILDELFFLNKWKIVGILFFLLYDIYILIKVVGLFFLNVICIWWKVRVGYKIFNVIYIEIILFEIRVMKSIII